MPTRLIEQWFKGNTDLKKEGWEGRLEDRLDELERTLGEWYQALRFGPVPGSYVDYHFRVHREGGLQSQFFDPQDAVVLPAPVPTPPQNDFYEIRPIQLGADVFPFTPSGSVDINIFWFDAASGFPQRLLVDDLRVTNGGNGDRATIGNGDFLVDRIFADWMALEITVVDGTAPETLSVHLLCNQSASFER